MLHANDFLIVLSITSLTSFLATSGLMALGFHVFSQRQRLLFLAYLLFVIGTLTATTVAVSQGTSSSFLAATIGWATVISWFVWRLELIGAFTAPVIAVTQLLSIFFAGRPPMAENQHFGLDMRIHVISAIIGQSFAVLACGMSLLFIWLDRKLKSRQISDLPASFPAMTTLTSSLNVTLWIGFTFITISLLSGAMYALNGMLPATSGMYAKIIWAILVWVWYLAILALKSILGYRPQRIARMTLAGFALMSISWFGLWFGLGFGQGFKLGFSLSFAAPWGIP
jgi:ABC-type uncharacterized transport system permease subunit